MAIATSNFAFRHCHWISYPCTWTLLQPQFKTTRATTKKAAPKRLNEENFAENIARHYAIMSVSARQMGSGQRCHECRQQIYGVTCFRRPGFQLHWSCAGFPKPELQQAPVQELLLAPLTKNGAMSIPKFPGPSGEGGLRYTVPVAKAKLPDIYITHHCREFVYVNTQVR